MFSVVGFIAYSRQRAAMSAVERGARLLMSPP
jgi:hypothetical protein